MAKNQEKIDAMVQNWDRLQLLNFLDIGDLVEQVGDNECVRPVSASTLSRFAIHKSHVPFLGKSVATHAQEQSFAGSEDHQLVSHASQQDWMRTRSYATYVKKFSRSMTQMNFM